MRCYGCHHQVSENEIFCKYCGKQINVNPDLYQRVLHNDQEAINQVYQMTYEQVYYSIKNMGIKEDQCDYISSMVYTYAFNHLDQIKEVSKFRRWLKWITAHEAYDYLKDIHRDVNFGELSSYEDKELAVVSDASPIPTKSLDPKENDQLLDTILDALPLDERAIVSMYYYETLSLKQISEITKTSINSVKTRLSRAQMHIEDKIKEIEKNGTDLKKLAPLAFFVYLLNGQGQTTLRAGLVIGFEAGKIIFHLTNKATHTAKPAGDFAKVGETYHKASQAAFKTGESVKHAQTAKTAGSAAKAASAATRTHAGLAGTIVAHKAATAVVAGAIAVGGGYGGHQVYEHQKTIQAEKANIALYNKTVNSIESAYYDYLVGNKKLNTNLNGQSVATVASRMINVSLHESSPLYKSFYDINGDGVKECLVGRQDSNGGKPVIQAIYTISQNKLKPVKILPKNSDEDYAYINITKKKEICTFQEAGDSYVSFERGHLKNGRYIAEHSEKIKNKSQYDNIKKQYSNISSIKWQMVESKIKPWMRAYVEAFKTKCEQDYDKEVPTAVDSYLSNYDMLSDNDDSYQYFLVDLGQKYPSLYFYAAPTSLAEQWAAVYHYFPGSGLKYVGMQSHSFLTSNDGYKNFSLSSRGGGSGRDIFYTFTNNGFKKLTEVDLSDDRSNEAHPDLSEVTQNGKSISYKAYQKLWKNMANVTVTDDGDFNNMSNKSYVKLTEDNYYKKIYTYKSNK